MFVPIVNETCRCRREGLAAPKAAVAACFSAAIAKVVVVVDVVVRVELGRRRNQQVSTVHYHGMQTNANTAT